MPPPASCAKSKQYLFHGLSDCETLAAWYEIQQIPNAKDLPPLGCNAGEPGKGPGALGLTKFLFDRDPPDLEPTPTPSPTKPPPERLHYLPYLQRSPSRKEAETPKAPARQAAAAATIIDARVAVNALAAKGQSQVDTLDCAWLPVAPRRRRSFLLANLVSGQGNIGQCDRYQQRNLMERPHHYSGRTR